MVFVHVFPTDKVRINKTDKKDFPSKECAYNQKSSLVRDPGHGRKHFPARPSLSEPWIWRQIFHDMKQPFPECAFIKKSKVLFPAKPHSLDKMPLRKARDPIRSTKRRPARARDPICSTKRRPARREIPFARQNAVPREREVPFARQNAPSRPRQRPRAGPVPAFQPSGPTARSRNQGYKRQRFPRLKASVTKQLNDSRSG